MIEIDVDEEIFLPCYRPLLNSTANINFLWGGRDSGKSYFIAQKLIVDCLRLDYFRCILIKKTFESIKDSQWQTIKDIVEQWGISHLFTFKQQPLEIHCINGNKFIARGCDSPEKLKSISNPSHAWYEEGNQLEEEDYIVATTTLRSSRGPVQEWFSFNPECEGDYQDFWLYRTFFKEHYDKGQSTFTAKVEFTMPDKTTYARTYTSTHTTYHDNPNCTPDRIANHESLKAINPYYYQIFTRGVWGTREAGARFLKCFNSSTHVGSVDYNPKLALHLSFDENYVPYFPCGIFQIDGNNIYMIEEVALYAPNNSVRKICNEIKRKYPAHTAGMYIYGDATSLDKGDVKQEEGFDLFDLICNELINYHPTLRVNDSNPSVTGSKDFANTVLELQFNGITFLMDERCKVAKRDFENTKEASDGRVDKKKITDKETGSSYQPYGHFCDLFRYFLITARARDYELYQNGNRERPRPIIGAAPENKKARY